MNEREIFSAALDLPVAERPAFLDQACGDDRALREGLEQLLREHGRSEGFLLDQPARRVDTMGPSMALSPGDTLASYEILGLLGAGGMGTVYRARDSRLGREVAIKVLPEGLARDEERLRRFEREARTLASLNHPNVAGIHGVDQQDDVCFLALELVPGEDLAERLARGPLPVDEALDVCRQIAEGLEAAHEAGVVHRDLKPANVRLTPDGVVKVLDFGLAKPMRPGGSGDGSTTAQSDSFQMTEEGLVLGTPTYMSPEQARGKPVDRRTDLWAFGCVLYECLTGRRTFGGDSMTDILAAIVGEEPDWDRLPPLPPRAAELLRRALAKHPRERLRDAGEARVQLELAIAERASGQAPGAPGTTGSATSGRAGRGPTALLVGVLALAVGYGVRLFSEPAGTGPADPAATTAGAALPMTAVLAERQEEVSDLELSPDGRLIAWTQDSGVFIRALDSFDVTAVTLEGAEQSQEAPYRLAWSPDGSQLAFTTPSSLWRVDADGQHLTLVNRVELSADSHAQLDWTRDGQLVYSDGASHEIFGRSFLVDRTTPLFSADEATTVHFDGVHILPDESPLVVRHRTGVGTPDTLSIWRDGSLQDVLQLPGWNLSGPAFADGLLVFERRDSVPNSIWSVAMDLGTGRTLGDPRLVVDDGLHATLAGDTLAYVVPDAPTGMASRWIDLEGSAEPVANIPVAAMHVPVLSHDGQRLLVIDVSAGGAVWAHDVDTGHRHMLGELAAGQPPMLALPDGRLVTIDLSAGMPSQTYATTLPGGDREPISDGLLLCVSRDGRLGLVFHFLDVLEDTPHATVDVIDLAGGGAPVPLVEAADAIDFSLRPSGLAVDISPDNRWALIPHTASGSPRIVVASLHDDSPPLTVIANVGDSAWFSASGDSIYYWTRRGEGSGPTRAGAQRLWQVSWTAEPEPTLGTPELLFELDAPVIVRGFDHRRDRFLLWEQQTAETYRIMAHTGWAGTGER